jgi:hydrogenase expression/formation protein HypC
MCLAIPGKILSIANIEEGVMRTAKVLFGGITKETNLELVPEAREGDYVLVHVGVALTIVDEEEAQKTLRFLEGSGEMDEIYN